VVKVKGKGLRDWVKGSRLRGQGVKGLGHSIRQTITVLYGVRAWSCWHVAGYSRMSFF